MDITTSLANACKEERTMTIESSLNAICNVLLDMQHPEAGKVDPYDEMRNRLNLCVELFTQWKEYFRRYSATLSEDIADCFNSHRLLGFDSPAIDPAEIKNAIEHPERPFDRKLFDMFTGPAEADLKIFRVDQDDKNPEVINAPTAYSIWGEVKEENGEFTQRITGSNFDFVEPSSLPDVWRNLDAGKLDVYFNAYLKNLGIVSWTTFYQNHKNQMRSLGYNLNGKLLWINQFLEADMTPMVRALDLGLPGGPVVIRKDQLILSIDQEKQEGHERYFDVYAMHIDFNFTNGTAKLAGPVLKQRNKVVSIPTDLSPMALNI
jgi:hypothetical protein